MNNVIKFYYEFNEQIKIGLRYLLVLFIGTIATAFELVSIFDAFFSVITIVWVDGLCRFFDDERPSIYKSKYIFLVIAGIIYNYFSLMTTITPMIIISLAADMIMDSGFYVNSFIESVSKKIDDMEENIVDEDIENIKDDLDIGIYEREMFMNEMKKYEVKESSNDEEPREVEIEVESEDNDKKGE